MSSCESGSVVHALEAAINLLTIGFLCIFWEPVKATVGSCLLSVGSQVKNQSMYNVSAASNS